jgi:hypothetical protein
MPQKCIKSYFLVVSDYFIYKNGPIDLIRGLFSNLDIGTHIPSRLLVGGGVLDQADSPNLRNDDFENAPIGFLFSHLFQT